MLYPAIALLSLTYLVWITLYVQRVRHMRRRHLSPQRMATPESVASLLPEAANRPANNLKNLFEMPVLFYALCAFTLALQISDTLLTAIAWLYVALRATHSLIHCTSNHVVMRFFAYVASCLTLAVMAARLVYLAP